jgi:hypothetical protein
MFAFIVVTVAIGFMMMTMTVVRNMIVNSTKRVGIVPRMQNVFLVIIISLLIIILMMTKVIFMVIFTMFATVSDIIIIVNNNKLLIPEVGYDISYTHFEVQGTGRGKPDSMSRGEGVRVRVRMTQGTCSGGAIGGAWGS